MKHETVRQKVVEKIELARKNGLKTLNLEELAQEILEENTPDMTQKRVQNIRVLVLDSIIDLGLKIKLNEGGY